VSADHALKCGTPQGSVLSPLLWSLVIDDLIAECEDACRAPLAGCVAVPIVFAVRGPLAISAAVFCFAAVAEGEV
jgi:hypothetical protein